MSSRIVPTTRTVQIALDPECTFQIQISAENLVSCHRGLSGGDRSYCNLQCRRMRRLVTNAESDVSEKIPNVDEEGIPRVLYSSCRDAEMTRIRESYKGLGDSLSCVTRCFAHIQVQPQKPLRKWATYKCCRTSNELSYRDEHKPLKVHPSPCSECCHSTHAHFITSDTKYDRTSTQI